MRLIRTEDAVGHVLCHDMTQIIPGVTKDARFRKGHVVTEEDIPVLLSIGKEHLYVWEKTDGMLHEDEGAERLRKIAQNENMHPSEVKEGKIELIADVDGLFQVDVGRLYDVNSVDEIMIATRHTNMAVRKGDKLAGMRVIPLVIDEKKLEEAEKAAGGKCMCGAFAVMNSSTDCYRNLLFVFIRIVLYDFFDFLNLLIRLFTFNISFMLSFWGAYTTGIP